jgi:DNA-binding LacI/PurR family transcriptional regulator
MKKRITIKDVAERAGVSHPTVSRAINDDPQISEATKERIRAIMKEMGYRPNLIARSLVRNKTKVFALVVPDVNPHVQPIIRGVVDECRQNDYALMLFSTDYWAQEESSYAYIVSNWQVDGVLIYNVFHHDRLTVDVEQLQADRLPFVFINKYLGEPSINTVAIDNRDAVKRAVQHLVELGHRRIGILNGGLMSVDGVERFEAFKKTLEEAGLEYKEDWRGDANYANNQAEREMERILQLPERPTAMFCANDLMAMGAIRKAQAMGFDVPDDLSFVGFDDIDAARWFTPALTTLHPPLRDIGGKAISLLIERIENPDAQIQQIPLQAELIVRDSTAAP